MTDLDKMISDWRNDMNQTAWVEPDDIVAGSVFIETRKRLFLALDALESDRKIRNDYIARYRYSKGFDKEAVDSMVEYFDTEILGRMG